MIDLTAARENVSTLSGQKRTPADRNGALAQMPVKCPQIRSICHYAAYQRHDPGGEEAQKSQSIGGGANRVQGLKISDWSEAGEGGLFAVLELESDEWLVLLPMVGRRSFTWFAPEGNELTVKVGTLGTESVEAELPVLAWSCSDSVYTAVKNVWRLALTHPLAEGMGRLREEKTYPEIFEYLGWCSWEQYKGEISSDVLVNAAEKINGSELPIRFFLVDDGYLCYSKEEGEGNQLVALGPDPETFPDGWRPLMEQRSDRGIRWFGLWQNFNGYWGRIARNNRLGEHLNSYLMDVPAGGQMPKPELPDAVAWYEAMLGVAREGGFDFVKVDNEANALHNYQGTANAVKATTSCCQAFERAAAAQVNGVINCMAHGPINPFNNSLSVVTRCSEDYKVNDEWKAKTHLHNSYQNMLWLGPVVWGDHDMFHSSDTFAGRMMAVSKAMSGAPVYLSDAPDDFNTDIIRPLCDNAGRLYRPLAPAVPLPESVTVDPFEDEAPYMVAAPLSNEAAAVVVYNLTEPTCPVEAQVGPGTYRDAVGLLNPERTQCLQEPHKLVIYDWYNGKAHSLEELWQFRLNTFEDRFLLLSPVISGWAFIGRTDKYLSPAGAEVLDISEDVLTLDVPEPCRLTVWREGRTYELETGKGIRRIKAGELE